LNKKLSPLAAFFLALLASGLGQIYNGQLYKGIIFFFSGYALVILSALAGLQRFFVGMIIFLASRIILQAYIIADALVVSIRKKEISLKFYNQTYIYILFILISMLSFFTINLLINNEIVGIKTFSIPSGAMQPTLVEGDYICADLKHYRATKPQRGDVAVFVYPKDPALDYIKRVIGLPGDKVEIKNKKIYINGALYETPQAIFSDPAVYSGPKAPPRDNLEALTIPPDSYFVLGDNRDHSYDSRFWGFVRADQLKGKALYIYYSRDREKSRTRWERVGKSIL
jgi:signal peptidase I